MNKLMYLVEKLVSFYGHVNVYPDPKPMLRNKIQAIADDYESLESYVGSNRIKSDYKCVDDIRRELNFWKNQSIEKDERLDRTQQQRDKLLEALKIMYEAEVDYMKINSLGDPDNVERLVLSKLLIAECEDK